MKGVELSKRVVSFFGGLVGSFVALYLLLLLPASAILGVVENILATDVDPWWERVVALVPALIGSMRYAVEYELGRRSLERLWTFVIVAHLLTYAALFPYFNVVHARRGFNQLLAGPGGSAAYYGVGFSLLALAIAAAYVLVYRDVLGITGTRRAA